VRVAEGEERAVGEADDARRSLESQCTPSDRGRQLHRSFHAAAMERVKRYQETAAYQKAMRKRKVWVEPLFAEAKQWHHL
jgi:hypothetical protein